MTPVHGFDEGVGVDDPEMDERCITGHSIAHGVSDEIVFRKFARAARRQPLGFRLRTSRASDCTPGS